MARPIKDTPILKGKDAKLFMENLVKIVEYRNTPEGLIYMKKERERIKRSYDWLQSIATFDL